MIVSPAYGSIVAPGEVVRIEVEVAPGHAYTSLAIVSPLGFSDIAKSSPYILTLTIPLDTSLREESLHVFGGREGKNGEEIAEMAADVERPDMPSKLWSQWTVLQLNA